MKQDNLNHNLFISPSYQNNWYNTIINFTLTQHEHDEGIKQIQTVYHSGHVNIWNSLFQFSTQKWPNRTTAQSNWQNIKFPHTFSGKIQLQEVKQSMYGVQVYTILKDVTETKNTVIALTRWRLVPSILGLGFMGNACYSKIKSSSTG